MAGLCLQKNRLVQEFTKSKSTDLGFHRSLTLSMKSGKWPKFHKQGRCTFLNSTGLKGRFVSDSVVYKYDESTRLKIYSLMRLRQCGSDMLDLKSHRIWLLDLLEI